MKLLGHLKVLAREGALDEFEAGLAAGGAPVVPSVAEFAQRWLALRRPEWKPSTVETRVVQVGRIVAHFGATGLDAVTTDMVLGWRALLAESFSPHSTNLHVGVLSAVMRAAVRERLVAHNPCDAVRALSPDRTAEDSRNWFTADECRRYLAAAKLVTPEWHPALMTLAFTGVRIGELFGLERRDVDSVGRVLHVRRRSWRGEVSTPKGGRARSLRIPSELVEALARQMGTHVHPVVFCRPDGRRHRDGSVLSKYHHRAREAAGIKRRVSPHGLRHTCGTLLALQGVREAEIQAFLGHSTTRMVARYMHVSPAAGQSDAIADALLRGPTGGQTTVHVVPVSD